MVGLTGCCCDVVAEAMRASDGGGNNFFFPWCTSRASLLDPGLCCGSADCVAFSTAGAGGSLQAATMAAVVVECG